MCRLSQDFRMKVASSVEDWNVDCGREKSKHSAFEYTVLQPVTQGTEILCDLEEEWRAGSGEVGSFSLSKEAKFSFKVPQKGTDGLHPEVQ